MDAAELGRGVPGHGGLRNLVHGRGRVAHAQILNVEVELYHLVLSSTAAAAEESSLDDVSSRDIGSGDEKEGDY